MMKNQTKITSIEKQADYYASVSFLGQKVGVYKSGYIKVEGEAFDITGIRYVKVTVETDDENVYTFEAQSENDLPTSMAFSTETSLSVDEYLFGKYPVTVEACDGAGNTAMVEKEVKGVFNDLAELFLDFLVDSWNTAVEVATALGDMIWEWIMEQVNKLWDAVLKPMNDLLEEVISFFVDCIMNFFFEINDFYWEGNSEPEDPNFNMLKELEDVEIAKFALFLPLYTMVEPLFDIVSKMSDLMKFIEPLQYLVDPMSLAMLILGQVPGVDRLMNMVTEGITGSISTVTTMILDFIMPLLGADVISTTELDAVLINPIAILNWANQVSWDPLVSGALKGISDWIYSSAEETRGLADNALLLFAVLSGGITGVMAGKAIQDALQFSELTKGYQEVLPFRRDMDWYNKNHDMNAFTRLAYASHQEKRSHDFFKRTGNLPIGSGVNKGTLVSTNVKTLPVSSGPYGGPANEPMSTVEVCHYGATSQSSEMYVLQENGIDPNIGFNDEIRKQSKLQKFAKVAVLTALTGLEFIGVWLAKKALNAESEEQASIYSSLATFCGVTGLVGSVTFLLIELKEPKNEGKSFIDILKDPYRIPMIDLGLDAILCTTTIVTTAK